MLFQMNTILFQNKSLKISAEAFRTKIQISYRPCAASGEGYDIV